MSFNPNGFARVFGDSLKDFLSRKGIREVDAAKLMGVSKARLNAYCHDSPRGTRPSPNADVLYRSCALLGFEFEYNGYRISAANLDGGKVEPVEMRYQQLPLQFDGQFDLTDEKGTVSISLRRPPGRVEVSFSLRANS